MQRLDFRILEAKNDTKKPIVLSQAVEDYVVYMLIGKRIP